MSRLRSFGEFWYDFVVGDDWRVAAAVIAALIVTWAVSTSGAAAWWAAPAAVAVILPYSLWRSIARR
ncbi:MAG TPA: hypothetical protein VKU88_12800 [Acidimicrobiales bacterium]|nr:hypothetical protein [Acidimicrobiales bacterium]